MLFPVLREFGSFISTREMSSVIRSYSGLSGLMSPIAHRTPRVRSRCNSDKMQLPLRENFLIINKQRKHPIENGRLRRFLESLAPALGLQERGFSVVFLTDEKMRRFNRDYRGFNKSTDVLSFQGDGGYLGDILISSEDRKSTRLNSSHVAISYAVFCLKKKKNRIK